MDIKSAKYDAERLEILRDANFPLSAKYDMEWLLDNKMGSQCLWLTEGLARDMQLKPGMRVLDLGCGRALTSKFLAQEFGVQVYATDLWVSATDNWKRICEWDLQDKITPIRAEAHTLPYADGFFDAAFIVNSYQFYGTSDIYFNEYLGKLVRPGGLLGFALPGLINDVEEYPKDWLETDQLYYHTLDYWRSYFRKCRADILHIDDYRGYGNTIIRKWEAAVNDVKLEKVVNDNMAWFRVIVRKK